MSLRHALLGILDIAPVSGYDVVKMFEASVNYYWHATHTQIYNTLKDLEKKELVEGVIHHQTGKPSKKVFHITENGKKELKKWLLEKPSLPSLKHSFMLKISLSAELPPNEILNQLSGYEEIINKKLTELFLIDSTNQMIRARNDIEKEIWLTTLKSGIAFYQKELEWITALRKRIKSISSQD